MAAIPTPGTFAEVRNKLRAAQSRAELRVAGSPEKGCVRAPSWNRTGLLWTERLRLKPEEEEEEEYQRAHLTQGVQALPQPERVDPWPPRKAAGTQAPSAPEQLLETG